MASRFRTAVESGDIEAAIALLAPDVTFASPVVFTPYEGREAVATLLRAIFQVFEDFRYVDELTEGTTEALFFEARIGDRRLEGVDRLRLDGSGQVAELTVMLRPASGLTAAAEAMAERLGVSEGGFP